MREYKPGQRYGVWAGNPKGQPEDPSRCVREVFPSGRGPMHHQCRSKRGQGPGGLYCGAHNPDTIKAKQKAADASREALKQHEQAIEKRGKALIKRLGCGQLHWAPGPGGKLLNSGYREALLISFKDIEDILEGLGQ